MNRHARFTQAEVTRAIKGVMAAGVKMAQIVVSDVGVVIQIGDSSAPIAADDKAKNELDKLIEKATAETRQ